MQSKQTMMAVLIAFVAIGLAGIGTYLAWPQPDDEERIRLTIYGIAEAARAADLTATIEPLDKGYSDASGLSRDEVTGFLFREYRARGPISVYIHAPYPPAARTRALVTRRRARAGFSVAGTCLAAPFRCEAARVAPRLPGGMPVTSAAC